MPWASLLLAEHTNRFQTGNIPRTAVNTLTLPSHVGPSPYRPNWHASTKQHSPQFLNTQAQFLSHQEPFPVPCRLPGPKLPPNRLLWVLKVTYSLLKNLPPSPNPLGGKKLSVDPLAVQNLLLKHSTHFAFLRAPRILQLLLPSFNETY